MPERRRPRGVRPSLRVLCLAALGIVVVPIALYAAFVVAPWGNAYIVASGSMEPTIDAGSIAFVVDSKTYEPGDVVSFERDGVIVTHRIVDRTDGGYVTGGDANAVPDDWTVPEGAIVGAVVWTIPHYGSLLSAAATSGGYVLFVLIPGLLVFAGELASVRERL